MFPFQVIGILNTTPDSYFDGGKYNERDSALRRVGEMLEEGADIIEIGGESTGPGSQDIGLDEELERTIPIIEAVRQNYPDARIAIDTYKAVVADAAIQAGAEIVNDVTAGRSDEAMLPLIAKREVSIVLMFAKDSTPRTTVEEIQYDDVVVTIRTFLSERKKAAESAGVDSDHIILDPGMGHFISGDPKYSYEVLSRLQEFKDLDCSLLVSPSRKSFLAGKEKLSTEDRLPGTIVASAISVINGAQFIRTHDVEEVRRGCDVAEEIRI